MLPTISQFLFSFSSTIGFAILFNSPRNCLAKAGLCGSIGWFINTTLKTSLDSAVAGTFFGALFVGFIGELFARLYKKPATVFIIPGVIPLVPGAGTYYTMFNLIQNNFSEAVNIGSDTIFTAIAIAVAIILSSSFSKVILRLVDVFSNKKEVIRKK